MEGVYRNCCCSFSEPVLVKDMSSIYLRDNFAFVWLTDKCVSSNIPIKVFAYVGAHFVTIAHRVIRKAFLRLNIKLFSVNIIFTKLMIIFARRFFCFSVVSTAWSPLSLELFCVNWRNFHHEAVPSGKWEGDFIGPWGTLNFHLPLGRLSQWGVYYFWEGGR